MDKLLGFTAFMGPINRIVFEDKYLEGFLGEVIYLIITIIKEGKKRSK